MRYMGAGAAQVAYIVGWSAVRVGGLGAMWLFSLHADCGAKRFVSLLLCVCVSSPQTPEWVGVHPELVGECFRTFGA